MSCCKNNSMQGNNCNSGSGFQSYFFIVLILFILLAIIFGSIV